MLLVLKVCFVLFACYASTDFVEGPVAQPPRRRNKNGEALSDQNTLSLSGLLNALDGVAASEGRVLFAYVAFPLSTIFPDT